MFSDGVMNKSLYTDVELMLLLTVTLFDPPDLCIPSGPYDVNCTGNSSHNSSSTL